MGTPLSEHMRAAVRLLSNDGHMTPQGARMLNQILDQHEPGRPPNVADDSPEGRWYKAWDSGVRHVEAPLSGIYKDYTGDPTLTRDELLNEIADLLDFLGK